MKNDKKKNAEVEVAAAVEKSNKSLYAILGVVLIALLVGGGYWWYSQPKKPVDYKNVTVGGAKSPTEAYQMLYAAVKSKDPEKIKLMMSENSIGFAGFVAGQQKKTVEEVLANGFTATTFSDVMPQMRDERIKDNFGALEVKNNQNQWEDLPFVLENGSWKLAIGDMFKGTYEKPGLGQDMREREAANAVNNNMIEIKPDANANNANVQMIIPKNTGEANTKNMKNPTLENGKKMITAEQIEEILSLYAKHGWTLRRVLLSDTLRVNLNEHLQNLFGGTEIISAPLDAAWFSRGETWEIRHLSNTPFALVEVFSAETTDEEREEKLNDIQNRLLSRASK